MWQQGLEGRQARRVARRRTDWAIWILWWNTEGLSRRRPPWRTSESSVSTSNPRVHLRETRSRGVREVCKAVGSTFFSAWLFLLRCQTSLIIIIPLSLYCTATYFCLFVFVYDSFAMFVWQMYSHVQLILVFSFSSLFVFVTSCVVNDLFFFELSMRICQLLAFFFFASEYKGKKNN